MLVDPQCGDVTGKGHIHVRGKTSRSGIPILIANPAEEDAVEKPGVPEETVELATTKPPYFDPGDGWYYSNTGYNLAGMVVEAATGSTLASEIRQRYLSLSRC